MTCADQQIWQNVPIMDALTGKYGRTCSSPGVVLLPLAWIVCKKIHAVVCKQIHAAVVYELSVYLFTHYLRFYELGHMFTRYALCLHTRV